MKSETSEWVVPLVAGIVVWVWIFLMVLISGSVGV